MRRPSDRFVVWAGAVAAFALRFLSFPGLTRDGLRLVSMDDYGHLRRAVATVREFPWVPTFDPFLHPPEGAVWIWPPLFDWLIAAPARLLFGRDADVAEVTLVAALLPPLLAAASIPPLYYLARRALDRRAAIITVGVYAALPAAIRWSSFGHADQHAGEAAAFIATLAAWALFLDDDGLDGDGLAALDPDDETGFRTCPTGRGLLAAAALAVAVLTWQGAVFLAPIVGAAGLVVRRARHAGLALIAAAGLVSPFAVGHPGPLTYISFGAFQPLFLALAGVLLLIASLPRWGLPLAFAAGLGGLAWPPISDGLRHLVSATEAVAGEHGIVAYPSEWLRLIGEYQPLFAGDASAVWARLSFGLLLVPLAIVVWLARAWREPERRAVLVLVATATVAVLAMALAQKRYAYYLAVGAALAIGWAVSAASRRHVAAGAVLLVLVLLPIWPTLADLPRGAGAAGADVFATLARLGELDPPATRARPPRPGEIEGVATPWSLGHLVTLETGRPALADNFGYGFHRQSWLYTAPPERDAEVLRRLRRWRCRYLISADLGPVLPAYAAVASHETVPPSAWLATRLQASAARRPLPFLELVLTSRTGSLRDGRFVPRMKIYRVLPETDA